MQKDMTPQQPKFDELIKEWKNMDRTTVEMQAAASTFYDEKVFPLVKETFVNKLENKPLKEYDALILPVGFSPEPLILSILAINPKRIGLLYTPNTETLLQRIQEETNLTLGQIQTREIDGSNIVMVYEAIMKLYEEWKRPTNIAVDITGGKKSMVSGVTMAGAVLGADIYYIDNYRYLRDLSKPEPGSEYLSLLDNPYTVFGDLEVEKAKDLYKGHDYAGAKRVFDELKQQVRDLSKASTYEAYGLLCAAYEAWDNLDIDKAKNHLENLLKQLNQFSLSAALTELRACRSRLDEQKKVLECLLGFINNEELALASPDGFHFAFTLYHNALRREAEGKLNTACLILYRLLEWVEQHRLHENYEINTSKPDYSKIDQGTVFKRYGEKRKDMYGDLDRSTLPNPIGLVDGFLVLYALQDDIVEGLNWRRFHHHVGLRNQTIYAHGMCMIKEPDFNLFKSTVEERFRKAQALAGIEATTFNEQHKFIAPLP